MGNRIKCELAGVVHSWTYSCFEALKVRDHRLEPVPHNSFYNSNPKGFEPQKGAEKFEAIKYKYIFLF